MKTTLHLLLIALAMLMAAPVTAHACPGPDKQADKPSREQLAEIQGQTIASKLNLNDADTKKFVALFCQAQKEIWAAAPPPNAPGKDSNKEISEQDAEKIIKERFTHKKKITAIQEKYYAKYSTFLTQRQILQAYDLEREIMDRMFRQHMRKHDSQGSSGTKRKSTAGGKKTKKSTTSQR